MNSDFQARMMVRAPAFAACLLGGVGLIGTLSSCQQKSATRQPRASQAVDSLLIADSASGEVRLDETGTNDRGIPRYTHRAFTAAERGLLRSAYGVDEPKWLYISDSSDAGVVKFDSKSKRCRTCFVDSYRLGLLSFRRPEETWVAFEKRMRGKHVKDFSPEARNIQRSLQSLDPESRAAFSRLIDDGRRAGFRLSIGETYRTPEREALLFALGHGRTYTATSIHSYGRAVDIKVDDGRLDHLATRRDWVRFRQFVLAQNWVRFHLLGTPDRTWDWPHVELASPSIGFHSIDDALAFAARCTGDPERVHPPAGSRVGADPCVFVRGKDQEAAPADGRTGDPSIAAFQKSKTP